MLIGSMLMLAPNQSQSLHASNAGNITQLLAESQCAFKWLICVWFPVKSTCDTHENVDAVVESINCQSYSRQPCMHYYYEKYSTKISSREMGIPWRARMCWWCVNVERHHTHLYENHATFHWIIVATSSIRYIPVSYRILLPPMEWENCTMPHTHTHLERTKLGHRYEAHSVRANESPTHSDSNTDLYKWKTNAAAIYLLWIYDY